MCASSSGSCRRRRRRRSPTTKSAGVPAGSYKKTAGANPIALPGTNGADTEWLSFPMFSADARVAAQRSDRRRQRPVDGPDGERALDLLRLPHRQQSRRRLSARDPGRRRCDRPRDLMMGEHQCIVAQIVYRRRADPQRRQAGHVRQARPAQPRLEPDRQSRPRRLAHRAPHLRDRGDAQCRSATASRPTSCCSTGTAAPPEGTEVRLYIPGWDSAEVVELADRFYHAP